MPSVENFLKREIIHPSKDDPSDQAIYKSFDESDDRAEPADPIEREELAQEHISALTLYDENGCGEKNNQFINDSECSSENNYINLMVGHIFAQHGPISPSMQRLHRL